MDLNAALFSPCGRYRYRLERDLFGAGLTIAYIGINPSTADALVDDPTTRKLRVFTRQEGGFRFLVGNVFAWRAVNVLALAGVTDPVGTDNRAALGALCREADVIVPIWGNRTKVPPRLRPQIQRTLDLLVTAGKPLRCLGQTRSGDPCHPLMLPYARRLQAFIP